MPLNELVEVSDISPIALNRHLGKLTLRGLVAETNEIYRFKQPSDPLLQALLELLVHS